MIYFEHNHSLTKKIRLTIIGLIFLLSATSQCPGIVWIDKQIEKIKNDSLVNESKKLLYLYQLQKKADNCNIFKDSIYARLLFTIGFYEYTNRNYLSSINFTLESIKINSAQEKGASKLATIASYINLAHYYIAILQYNKSLSCCDSAIVTAQNCINNNMAIAKAKLIKAYIYYLTGDYQKCIEESTKGAIYAIAIKDTFHYCDFLIQRSQSLFIENNITQSLIDINSILKNTNDAYKIASAYKIKASIFEKQKSYTLAEQYFSLAIISRIKSNKYDQIAKDYIDLGNFYFLSLVKISKAKKSYFDAIEYATKDNNPATLASIYTNLGNLNLTRHNYTEAGKYYIKALQILNVATENIGDNLAAANFNRIGNTEIITELLTNKVLLLLGLFKQTKDKKYIEASIQTALITDTVITQKRHQQLGEQSKIYWRNQTRDFFTSAIEACFLANDVAHAFYFMEKSRSVLLNDKLNELGASTHISDADAKKELDLKIKILQEQQKLNELTANTSAYNSQEPKFLNVKQYLEDFIKSLETKYPAYYNYKYSEAIPSLETLQKYLAINQASFVHYFTNDTVAYILSIAPGNAKMIKLSKNDFNYEQINDFLRFSSNRDLLNTKTSYRSFAALSNTLYKTLFQPLQLPKGRVVICSDNFLLPFESLCSDTTGTHFLINDYIFSYAYSATYLLKQFNRYPAKGNFIGFAPVSFQPALHVNSLINSATALNKSAANYSSTLLFTNEAATKNNFIKNIGGYTVVNVFSHASADSSEKEPRLYMQDATINLSELQLINKPAARLVVLSACQTNVGKNSTGEGIYSLARGFTSAGIPAVAATLWNADEDMIYEISAKFHEYLSQGMSKDIALRKAKLDFLNSHGNTEKSLPYYWANLILIGNTEPLQLSAGSNKWWWIAGSGIALIAVIVMILKQRRSKHSFRL